MPKVSVVMASYNHEKYVRETIESVLSQLPDWDFWIRLCMRYDIHIIPENLTKFRLRANEANASGNRADVATRTTLEISQVLRNYLNPLVIEDFLKIFHLMINNIIPEVGVSASIGEIETELVPFFLAKMPLQMENPALKYFEFDLLYQMCSNAEIAGKLKNKYSFDFNSLTGLASQQDIFGIISSKAMQADYNQIQSELEQTRSELTQSQSELELTRLELTQSQSELKQAEMLMQQSEVLLAQYHQRVQENESLLKEYQEKAEQTRSDLENLQSQFLIQQEEKESYQVKLLKSEAVLKELSVQLQQTEYVLQQSQVQQMEVEIQANQEKNLLLSLLEQSQTQLRQTEAVIEESNQQLQQTRSDLENSQAQLLNQQTELANIASKLEQNQKQLYKFRLERFFASDHTNSPKQTQYRILVWEAWYAYQHSDYGQMVKSLQQSLQHTPLSKTETIVNWLESFAKFSSENGFGFDSRKLIGMSEWQQLTRQSMLSKVR